MADKHKRPRRPGFLGRLQGFNLEILGSGGGATFDSQSQVDSDLQEGADRKRALELAEKAVDLIEQVATNHHEDAAALREIAEDVHQMAAAVTRATGTITRFLEERLPSHAPNLRALPSARVVDAWTEDLDDVSGGERTA